MTFVATYDEGQTASVTPTSCTPSVWGEAGTETITFSFAGTDVTCEVEGTAIAPTTLTSLTYTGTLTNDQFVGSAPDLTGLTFTAHYSDSTLDQEVTPTSVLPATYSEAGSATVTATYTDEYGTASTTATVTAIAKALTSLAYSGTFGTQTLGSAPDLTGITFTAHYNDSTLDHEVDDGDITVSPATWAESGSQTLTMSYTDEYGTASTTATVTVNE